MGQELVSVLGASCSQLELPERGQVLGTAQSQQLIRARHASSHSLLRQHSHVCLYWI